MHKTRICIACGEGHNCGGRLCPACRESAAVRTLRDRVIELERENMSLQRDLLVAREARVAVERPRATSLWWYHERDLLATGASTATERARVNRFSVEEYLGRVYGTPAPPAPLQVSPLRVLANLIGGETCED